uniref:Putative ovule protein n=1 Tax=Solanum chacoense TaxID=4108 RepID=A0A0V0I3Z9_SOLCH
MSFNLSQPPPTHKENKTEKQQLHHVDYSAFGFKILSEKLLGKDCTFNYLQEKRKYLKLYSHWQPLIRVELLFYMLLSVSVPPPPFFFFY